ncbi:hypothetical protein A2154_00340 [Candidatus Gottesmanbacteria bacterium RBG_16_43_7]|uniref:ABC transporter permease n=1 Tax=Candidatus Gottesmanbacteria bacterium RBG_16_43_7 TaxID=1798373 RepID=A0A1F5Z807_9BACT|nr:MAG: hypothetical protein A2154_00340 [Candidatus Gottesmanbacteria bacterium RBG_16_43_7]
MHPVVDHKQGMSGQNPKLYLQIFKNTWSEIMTYRVNFLFWRIRMVMQMLVVYFLWNAFYANRTALFGYSREMMLTYVLLISIVRTIVLSTTTVDIGNKINQGDLSNYLVKPICFVCFYFSRDMADKLLNLICGIFEVGIFILILNPPLAFQPDLFVTSTFLVAAGIGAVLYFYFSLLIGFIGFWSTEVWAPRFLSLTIMEFFAGTLFPLDILPQSLYTISQVLPFHYFIYFPIKVYLGQLTQTEILAGLTVSVGWVILLLLLTRYIWSKGLKIYQAEGK